MKKTQIAVVGMGVMGKNLALNFASKGYRVTIYNRTVSVAEDVIKEHPEAHFTLARTVKEMVDQLEKPRKILMMIKAGEGIDHLISQLLPLLETKDVLIDGGNSYFKDTQRRYENLQKHQIGYVGLGVSGGETGARKGPALMPGTDKQTYEELKEMLNAIGAKAQDGTPCAAYLGTGGAGHFVKMVHNGIEYAEMEMIAEIYDLFHNVYGYANETIGDLFSHWNEKGLLASYLVEITGKILMVKDPLKNADLLDSILDVANQKGTGKWTSLEAVDLGVDASILTAALNARYMSMEKRMRKEGETLFRRDVLGQSPREEGVMARVYQGLLCAKILTYAQGFSLYRKASEVYGWSLDYKTIASSFRAGCIIRSVLLEDIMAAFDRQPDLENLIFDERFSAILKESIASLRKVVVMMMEHGCAAPALSSALTYFDEITRERSTANILQAQRDYFGAHTYERIDQPGVFHAKWEEANPVAKQIEVIRK